MKGCFNPIRLKSDSGNFRDVPCGKCIPCLNRRRNSWTFRLMQELKSSTSAHFITLTYDDDNLPRSPTGIPIVSKRDCQLFFKRFRKLIYPFKVRYFLVSEYGSNTFRPHYHIILFGFPRDFDISVHLSTSWTKGFHHVGNVTHSSIHYCTKYVLTATDLPAYLDDYKCFMLCSRKPALGSSYLTSAMIAWHQSGLKNYVLSNQFKQAMPRYYREKVFTKEQLFYIRQQSISFINSSLRKYVKDFGDYDDVNEVSMMRQQQLAIINSERKKMSSARNFSKI